MNRVTKTNLNMAKNHNGFGVELTETTDVGSAMLIAEFPDSGYEPVGVASNVREARELAKGDVRRRASQETPVPVAYKLWARGVDGEHRIAY